MAEARNQVMKARVSAKVVTHSVFQARPESQSDASGSHAGSQSLPVRTGGVVS